jgi:hypothetical protein
MESSYQQEAEQVNPANDQSYRDLLREAEKAVREGIKFYSQGQRLGYGLLWAFRTPVLVIAGFTAFGAGSVGPGLILLALAFLARRYDYRL